MLSRQTLEHYRRMSPRERIEEMRGLIDFSERSLRTCTAEEVARRLAVLDEERRRSKESLLAGLRRLGEGGGPKPLG